MYMPLTKSSIWSTAAAFNDHVCVCVCSAMNMYTVWQVMGCLNMCLSMSHVALRELLMSGSFRARQSTH